MLIKSSTLVLASRGAIVILFRFIVSHQSKGIFSNISADVPASIVVFLVAMPLCLGIALASGAPAFSGIIAGIIGGVLVTLISGSQVGVSGPAAGLAVIVSDAITDLGGWDALPIFFLAVMISGVFQVLMGLLKLGIIGYYFPNSVIKGMLCGIGLVIFFKQFPHALGYNGDPEGDLSFWQIDGHNTLSELMYMFQQINMGSLIIAVVGIAVLVLWEQAFIKKISLFQWVKGPLVVVLLGILLNLLFQKTGLFYLSPDMLVQLDVPGTAHDFIGQFSLPDFSAIGNSKVWMIGGTIAVVASLETLLCVEATDKLDPLKRVTPTNRELIAQGAGNIAAGFVGGLPITQVIVRSSANIQSGGRTKLVAFLHGVLILLSVMFIPKVLNMIPFASLAAILFQVGYKLAKPSIFKAVYAQGLGQFIPFIVTVIVIYFSDLLTGIGLGLAVGIFQILWKNFRTSHHSSITSADDADSIEIRLAEDVSFLNKANILNALSDIPEGKTVVIDGRNTRHIHPDVVEILLDFIGTAERRNIRVSVLGMKKFGMNEVIEELN